MKKDIATANDLTRGQESAVLLKIADQTGIQNVTEAAIAFLRGSFELTPVRIIKILGNTKIIATTDGRFIAKDKFTMDSSEINFKGIWGNFTKWFLVGDGKTEELIEGRVLYYGNLLKDSADGSIIEELGGEARVESTLTELYNLIKKQTIGEKGVLLANGYANIFYVRDITGVVRTLCVYWERNCWHVYAYFLGSPPGWKAESRIFFRNF